MLFKAVFILCDTKEKSLNKLNLESIKMSLVVAMDRFGHIRCVYVCL